MDKPTCKTCPYYRADMQNHSFGLCMFSPPTTDKDGNTRRPETYAMQWCSEHPDFPKWIESQRDAKADVTENAETVAQILREHGNTSIVKYGQPMYWDDHRGQFVPRPAQDCTTPPE